MSATVDNLNDTFESGELTESSIDCITDISTTASEKEDDVLNDSVEISVTKDEVKPVDDIVVDYEREEGDGQEYESEEETEEGELGGSSDEEKADSVVDVVKEKKLDDDEDRRNPQYIPKRGTFYEHDDRTAEEEPASTEGAEPGEQEEQGVGGKKVWKEAESKWAHDMYNDDEQRPKTSEELIELYGYDIRNEEGPPRARRRRRYGRGPNKYTRNWEDEGAYNRPGSVQGGGGGGGGRRGGEEEGGRTFYSNNRTRRDKEAFPALPGADTSNEENTNRSAPHDERPLNHNAPPTAWTRRDNNNPRPAPPRENPRPPPPRDNNRQQQQNANAKSNNNRPLQLTPPPERRVLKESQPSSRPTRHPNEDLHEPIRKAGTGRGGFVRRGGKPGVEAVPSRAAPSSRFPAPPAVVTRAALDESYTGSESSQMPGAEGLMFYSKTAAPDPGSGPKLKTRDDLANDLARMNIYESAEQARPAQTREFPRQPDNKYQQPMSGRQQAVVPPRLQQESSRPKRYSSLRQRTVPEQQQQYAPPPAQQHQYYQTGYVQQVQPPLQLLQAVHAPPTTYAGSFPSPPAFIQPAPLLRRPPSPAHYPQAVMSYVQQPQPFPAQPYPPFQAFTTVAAPPPQPPDMGLYQPQGGITYYSPEEQMMSRALTQRRQRTAIPIVPPPDRYRGRGRRMEGDEEDYGGQGDQDGGDYQGDHYSDDDGRYEEYSDAKVDAGDAKPEGMKQSKSNARYEDAETSVEAES